MSRVSILDAMVAGSGSAPLPLPDTTSASTEASNLHALPFSRRELFGDHRGRGLRASWHPERGLVVLSLWKDDVCAGTVHLSPDDAARLAAFLDAPRGSDRVSDGRDDVAPTAGSDVTVPLQVLRGE